jgi:hypothetical protein
MEREVRAAADGRPLPLFCGISVLHTSSVLVLNPVYPEMTRASEIVKSLRSGGGPGGRPLINQAHVLI